METNFTLIEHSFIYAKKDAEETKKGDSNIAVSQKVFEEIKAFVLKNVEEKDNSVVNFLIPGYAKGFGEILKAKNYVGVIQTKKGITIEILPKIYSDLKQSENPKDEIAETKKIFLKMLRTLKKSPFKISNYANLDLSKMPLLDIFINMFLVELSVLVKQGLRKDYIPKSENLFTLKGKLDFNKNIKHNFAHKERFFVNYDEFDANRPENKLIKSTLLFLSKKATSNSTQQKVRKFSFVFDEISPSKNIDVDLEKCSSNRLTYHYEKILAWCRIFLKNQSFSNYKGKDLAFALLFPMERIFEDFVAHQLRKHHSIQTQKTIGSLLIEPDKYKMKPDIVFSDKNIIADTKWKILDEKHQMTQSDLYQMFAYGTHPKRNIKDTERIILIYPKTPNFPEKKEYQFSEELLLEIFPYDLVDENNNEKLLE
ncbi:MAG: McrC family protein [Candidatus Cloacimonadota bacterium]|nr:McrC family protein [Candidatus Cloacimonadota bacterium]